jgi:hypothetical protein
MASESLPATPQIASVEAQSEYSSNLEHDHLLTVNPSAHPSDTRSDYGSEFDTDTEQILEELLTGVGGGSGKSLVLESIVEDDNKRSVAYLPKCSSQNDAPYSTHPESNVVEKTKVNGDTRTAQSTCKTQRGTRGGKG